MSQLVLTPNDLIGTPASGNIEYNGQFYGTDNTASRAQIERLVLATAQNSTSGTSIDFTGIPAWAKKITVMFNGVSVSGTSNLLVQVGAGSVTTSGYVAGSMSGGTYVSATTGLILVNNIAAADLYYGIAVLTNITGNTWVSLSNINKSGSIPAVIPAAGTIALGGTLDRVRITTVNGTDTFDAGSINILYEG